VLSAPEARYHPIRHTRARHECGAPVAIAAADPSMIAPGLILVVDDEVDFRYLTALTLRDAGYEVREVGSGEDALSSLDGVDLVLLDYRLPGLTGLETLREIAANDGPGVVFMTAMGSEEVAVEAMRSGAIDYLAKGADYLVRLPEVIARAARVYDLTRRVGETQRLAQGLLEAAPDPIVVVDAAGIIKLVNRQTCAVFGWDRLELLGQPMEILMPPRLRGRHPGLRLGYVSDPKARPMGEGVELVACRRDGTEFPVDVSLSPLETEDGLLISAAIRDVTERKRAEAALAHQATHDALTGLPNRNLLEDRLAQAVARSNRTGGAVAVLFLDVDRLKVINDSRGHSAGDQLLRAVASRLADAVRPDDTLARFGGDEFVIVTEGIGESYGPELLVDRIADVMAAPITLDGVEVIVSVSIGVALSSDGDGAEGLLRDADAAMYRAKDQGRDRFVLFDSNMRAGAVARLDTENALRRALEREEFRVHYQPVVELTAGNVVGVEALVRWQDPERGLVPPVEFIPLAEETGLIVALGAFVLREACHQVAAWHRLYPQLAHLGLAVNLSGRQLVTPFLPEVIEATLANSGLEPSRLCLEITESVLLDDAESSSRALAALKALSVRIGVDDFGTGYSSLTYLKRFPVDTLKIDKSFVDGLGGGSEQRGDRAIVAGTIDLAHAFGLTTIAEGVETADQLAELCALGCEQAQGYYWSRALPADDALQWLLEASANCVVPDATPFADTEVPLRLLLVEDDRSLRGLVRLALEGEPSLRIVAEAEDGREAVALARHHQPDLVLLDLAMPGVGGLEALPLIMAVAPDAKVVVMSGLDEDVVAQRAYDQGAVGYIVKGGDIAAVVDQLKQIRAHAT
jgi:diguanylate cyclase (GGDEF)-like protein/PAS domain S-box-containing protein